MPEKKVIEEVGLGARLRIMSVPMGKQVGDSRVADISEGQDPFSRSDLYDKKNLLTPPLGANSLTTLVETTVESNILEQCLHAFETNIDGFGHRFDLILPPEEFPEGEKNAAAEEKSRLTEFFDFCYAEGSFVDLRQRKRRDQESTGIAYWEVLREPDGRIKGFNHVPSHMVRMTPPMPELVTINEVRRTVSAGQVIERPVKISRRFRMFAQIVKQTGSNKLIWFKEFGDPRSYSYKTGDPVGVKTRDSANELIAWPVKYHPLSPYSVPRWIGNLPSVLGSRGAEEVNLLYFDNKTIPPQVITVTGGRLTQGTVRRIQEMLDYEIKGRENFHKTLILEAVSSEPTASGDTSSPKIEIKPLTDQMLKDAMFMGYDDSNRRKVRSSFRLAPLFTGETEDYTRATAEASRLLDEEQMFRPERLRFDYWVNRWLMPELGAKYVRFVSNGPNVTLNEDLIALLSAGESAGGMTPNLAREIMRDVLERNVPRIEEPWGDEPWSLTLARARAEASLGFGGGGPGGGEVPPPVKALLNRFREEIREEIVRRTREKQKGK